MATQTNFTTTGPNTLNNATVVYQAKFDPQKFTDLNFLYNTYSKDSFTTYKGLLSLWNQRDIICTPLLNYTELSNSVMYVPNMENRIKLSVPYDIGYPRIVENMESDNPNAGKDGQPFKIKLNSNSYTATDILTYDELDGIQVFVTSDEEVYEDNGGWVYTVQIVGSNRRNISFPQQFMQPGTPFLKIQNANGEYETQMSSITQTGGIMDLEIEMGNSHRSVTHWVTGYADMTKVDENKSPMLRHLNSKINESNAVTLYANTDARGRIIKDSMSWHTTIELLLRAEIEKMTEKALNFAQGGTVTSGHGRRKIKVASGLIPQLRNGNRVTYSKISLEMIERYVANLFVNSGVPVDQRFIKIQTGQGGLNQIAKELYERFKNVNPWFLTGKDVPGGIMYGSAMNAGFKQPRFTQFDSPIAGHIEFIHNPALDSLSENRIQDGLVGEYPNSSYTYLVLDVTDSGVSNAASKINSQVRVQNGFNEGSNLILLKPEGYGDVYWGYINGTHSPFGPASMKGMFSANAYNGYQIWMKSFGSLWVRDVTRTLIIERAKPGTIYGANELPI